MSRKPTYNFDKKYFYIYYQLANKNNKIRMINCFADEPKTIDSDDIKYKDYGKIPLKFIEGTPSDEMLRMYLKKFKTWMCSVIVNIIIFNSFFIFFTIFFIFFFIFFMIVFMIFTNSIFIFLHSILSLIL